MEAGAKPKPWYRRSLDRKYQILMAIPWAPGFALAVWAPSIGLRLVGLALIWVGVGVWVYGLLHSEDA